MTEHNYFCYSEDKNKDGFQQKRYRIFNKEISKEEYFQIKKIHNKLEFDKSESYETRYSTAFRKMRESLDNNGRKEYIDIPYFDADIFKKITGIDVNVKVQEMTLADVCKELGRNIKIVK